MTFDLDEVERVARKEAGYPWYSQQPIKPECVLELCAEIRKLREYISRADNLAFHVTRYVESCDDSDVRDALELWRENLKTGEGER